MRRPTRPTDRCRCAKIRSPHYLGDHMSSQPDKPADLLEALQRSVTRAKVARNPVLGELTPTPDGWTVAGQDGETIGTVTKDAPDQFVGRRGGRVTVGFATKELARNALVADFIRTVTR